MNNKIRIIICFICFFILGITVSQIYNIYNPEIKEVSNRQLDGEWYRNETGDWVCVNIYDMNYSRAVEVCKHEVGHEIFAEVCEKDFDKCKGILK